MLDVSVALYSCDAVVNDSFEGNAVDDKVLIIKKMSMKRLIVCVVYVLKKCDIVSELFCIWLDYFVHRFDPVFLFLCVCILCTHIMITLKPMK